MAKRIYDYELELDRLEESFYNVYGKSIRDREGFEMAWNEYFDGAEVNDFITRSKDKVWYDVMRRNQIAGTRLEQTKMVNGKVYKRTIINDKPVYYREQKVTYTRYYDENGKQIKKPK